MTSESRMFDEDLPPDPYRMLVLDLKETTR